MTDNHEHVLTVFGVSIRFIGLGVNELKKRLGTFAHVRRNRPPQLTVSFVPSLRAFRRKGFSEKSPHRLLGNGFALDYSKRLLHYPLTAPKRVHIADRQPQHFLLARTIVYAMALLQEAAEPGNSVQLPFLYLHASAVATSKGALVFCGESTFGKSTISGKLLTGFAKLDDDLTMLRLDLSSRHTRPEVLVFGTGLRAKRQRLPRRKLHVRTLPLAAIFWLRKSPDFEITPVDRAVFASQIMMPIVNWTQPRAIANRLALLRELLRTVPCAELSFAKKSKPLIKMLELHGYA